MEIRDNLLQERDIGPRLLSGKVRLGSNDKMRRLKVFESGDDLVGVEGWIQGDLLPVNEPSDLPIFQRQGTGDTRNVDLIARLLGWSPFSRRRLTRTAPSLKIA